MPATPSSRSASSREVGAFNAACSDSGFSPRKSAIRRICTAAGGRCFQNALSFVTCGSVTRSSMWSHVQPVHVISQA